MRGSCTVLRGAGGEGPLVYSPAVMVTDKGLIYREEFYTSLSAVAGKIMGMSYNGPLLFGMRDKEKEC